MSKTRPIQAWIGCLVVFLALGTPHPSWSQERIAAIVNDDIISRRDLTERLKLALLTTNQPNTRETRRRMAPQVMRGVIDETLQLQEARRLRLDATDDDLQRSLNDIASRNNMTTAQLLDFLENNGVPSEYLRDQVRAQVSWLKIVRGRIRPRVIVTDEQVSLILDQRRAEAAEPQLQLSEIVLPVYSPDQEPAVIADAQDIIDSINDEADFASLAEQFSVGSTKDDGGDLGWVSLSSMSGAFRDALSALPAGSLSKPVRSPQGIHIFTVRDRRNSAEAAVSGNELSLAQMFFPVVDLDDSTQRDAGLLAARNIAPRLGSCSAIERAAGEQDTDGSGILGWIDPDDLPEALASAVQDLPIEQISDPVRGPSGIHLMMVCATREGGSADEAERFEIKQRLENEQTDRLANRYLRDLRIDAFIDIRL